MEQRHDATTEERVVREDGSLAPVEKQVSIVGTKDDGTFTVHSEVGSVTRGLLDHPEFEVTETRESDGDIVAVTGELPRGALSVKSSSRKTDQWSTLVNTPTDD